MHLGVKDRMNVSWPRTISYDFELKLLLISVLLKGRTRKLERGGSDSLDRARLTLP